jgi:hypothetical protein
MKVGQVYERVPSPTALGKLFGASFDPPRTPPIITLGDQELYIYELSRLTKNKRCVSGSLRIAVGPRAGQLEDRPPCAQLIIQYAVYDEDGPEYDEGRMPAEPGYHVAIVEEVEPGFTPTPAVATV